MATLTVKLIRDLANDTHAVHELLKARTEDGHVLSVPVQSALQTLRFAQRELANTLWNYDVDRMKKTRRAAMKPTSRAGKGDVGTRQTEADAKNDH